MSKHTLGPWIICDTEIDVYAPQGDVIVMRHCPAPIEYNQPDFSIHDDEQLKANARLIAAAPELLEALRLAAEHIDCEIAPDGSVPQSTQVLLGLINSAIAKAEGVNQ